MNTSGGLQELMSMAMRENCNINLENNNSK